jgi:hypothetical protein
LPKRRKILTTRISQTLWKSRLGYTKCIMYEGQKGITSLSTVKAEMRRLRREAAAPWRTFFDSLL